MSGAGGRVVDPSRRPGTSVGGVHLDAVDAETAIRRIVDGWVAGVGGVVVTPNVDIVRQAARHQELARVLASADLSLADGMPLVWASRIAGAPLPGRAAMSELVGPLARAAAGAGAPLFLLGDDPVVAEKAARVLEELAPGLVVIGTSSPAVSLPLEPAALDAIAEQLIAAGPAIVICAFGCPKQELLMDVLAPKLPGTWLLAAGATLRMLSGTVAPAPTWMRRRGLEWLHRLRLEPGRLAGRYLVRDAPVAVRILLAAAADRIGPLAPSVQSGKRGTRSSARTMRCPGTPGTPQTPGTPTIPGTSMIPGTPTIETSAGAPNAAASSARSAAATGT